MKFQSQSAKLQYYINRWRWCNVTGRNI